MRLENFASEIFITKVRCSAHVGARNLAGRAEDARLFGYLIGIRGRSEIKNL